MSARLAAHPGLGLCTGNGVQYAVVQDPTQKGGESGPNSPQVKPPTKQHKAPRMNEGTEMTYIKEDDEGTLRPMFLLSPAAIQRLRAHDRAISNETEAQETARGTTESDSP